MEPEGQLFPMCMPPGGENAMFDWDKAKGKLERVGFRYCYTWPVYRRALEQLQMPEFANP